MSKREFRVFVEAMAIVPVVAEYTVMAQDEDEAIAKAEAGDYENLLIVDTHNAVEYQEVETFDEKFDQAIVQTPEESLEQLDMFEDEEDSYDQYIDNMDEEEDW